jgi:hypothetical protein
VCLSELQEVTHEGRSSEDRAVGGIPNETCKCSEYSAQSAVAIIGSGVIVNNSVLKRGDTSSLLNYVISLYNVLSIIQVGKKKVKPMN